MEYKKKLPTLSKFIRDSIAVNSYADGIEEIAITYASRKVYDYMIKYLRDLYSSSKVNLKKNMDYYIENETIRDELYKEITREVNKTY